MTRTARAGVCIWLTAAGVMAAGSATRPATRPATQPASRPAATQPMGLTGILSEEGFKALHELRQDRPPAARGELVELAGGRAYLSLPEGRPRAGVVVIHEWWGLNDNIKHWSDRLAADGYAALAVDLYGGAVATTPDQAMAAMKQVDEQRALELLAAAHAFLRSDERVAAARTGSIGWCFGGGWSLRLALAEPQLDAAVIYYGRLITDPAQLQAIEARVLGVFGNQDQGIPPDQVDAFEEALTKAMVDHRILRYDAQHAFANPSSARYDQQAAEQAWAEVRGFLSQMLEP